MTEQRNEALVEVHGVSPEHTEEQATAVGNAMLIVLGSAGLIMSMEMNRFVEIAADYDATPEEIAGWRRFDYANANLADQMSVEPRLARHMMYEAVRIIRPSAPPGPSRKITAVARTLGVQQATVSMLEAAVTAEEMLARARATLERSAKRRPGVVSPKIEAGFATITEQEADIRQMRLKAMEDG
ncbi:MAG: hypothetical protein QM820_46290 [Minicystis sp.]